MSEVWECPFCGGNADDPDHWMTCGLDRLEDIELYAGQGHPETSHAAMAAFDKDVMFNAAALVVQLHRVHGPLADYELEQLFAATYPRQCCVNLYRQARSSARDKGLIRDSGARKRNPTTNRQQVIWEACLEDAPALARCETCGQLLRRSPS